MKRITVILFSLAMLAPGLAAQTVIRIAAPAGTEPYIPVLTAIYSEMGYKVEITILPAERAVQVANAGEYDAHLGLAGGQLAAYPNLMYTTEPIISTSVQAWAKKGSAITIAAPVDLKKYKVALMRGSKLCEALVANLGITAESVADGETLSRMLSGDRIEVALTTSAAVPLGFSATFVIISPNLLTANAFHVLNKKNAALAPKVDAVIKAMKADGRFQKLLPGK